MRTSILVSYVIAGDTWLNNFGRLDVSYFSDIHFERISFGGTTECRLGIIFLIWCIVNLYFFNNFCSAFLILVLSNYIRNLWNKMISWISGGCYVTMTSEFSDHIKKNCLFLTREKTFLKSDPF